MDSAVMQNESATCVCVCVCVPSLPSPHSTSLGHHRAELAFH